MAPLDKPFRLYDYVFMTRSAFRKRRPNSEELSRWFIRAQQKEPGALQQLLTLYRPLLVKLAQQKLKGPVRAKVDPSDIVQMTIWNVTQDFEAKQFRDRKGFVAWVAMILKNVAADERRRFQDAQKRDIYREHPLNSPETQKWLHQLSVTLSGTNSDPSYKLVDVETVLAAIQALPPHYQLMIRLRYYEQLKFEDIGRTLERSTDAARVMHSRALKKLRDILLSLNGPAPPD